ncbi:MAG: hypothetical protein H6954_03760 [Chromatiaceae bacterium]|nr:hypothetical protein [Chromatiaceae bacterium]
MPAGVLIQALSWLAGHLILVTLAVFVVAGFMVFDGDGPSDRQGAEAKVSATVDEQAPQGPAGMPDRAAEGPFVPMDQAPAAAGEQAPASAHRQPVLIGGSIPIYDVMGHPGTGAPAGGSGDALTAPPAGQVQSKEARLQAARHAFWNGDFESAEAGYMELLSDDPTDADIFGELGNLYEAMGQQVLALDAFYEAGVRLRQSGDRQKLSQVVEILKKAGDERHRYLSQD